MFVVEKRAESTTHTRVHLAMLLVGVLLFTAVMEVDLPRILSVLRFPAAELNNQWVLDDLATLRRVALAFATLLLLSSVMLWRYRDAIGNLSEVVRSLATSAARLPLVIPTVLAGLILVKTVIQLTLYVAGYTAYAADDFSRSLSADYWLQHRTFDFGSGGWVGLHDSAWLPFSDYVFGLGLAIHRDIFLTPKFVNLLVSGALVVVAYLLGRELFGRMVGVLTAAVLAFQPWYVWIGMSGMTSDLPSAVLIGACGVFLARWLRTGNPRALLVAAGALAAADGFRYENWLFSGVFSVLIVLIAASSPRRDRSSGGQMIPILCALAIANSVPILWMTASRVALGVWLPALQVINGYSELAFSASSTPAATISIPLLLIGCFPFEVILSIAGAILFLRSDDRKLIWPYLILPVATFLLFATIFKWRVPAWMMIGRYFLTFVVLLAPFAGWLVTRLIRSAKPWRQEGLVGGFLIVATLGILDAGRIANYPAMFPKDAIAVGWAVRRLQSTGAMPVDSRILIERTEDWGHLGIVALANRPERFVLLGDARDAVADPQGKAAGTTVPAWPTICDSQTVEACRNSIHRDGFRLVIVSSEKRAASFQKVFPAGSWRIGRYLLFEVGRPTR